ncbi:MAG: polysaccharide deacetylase family protein [Pseudomonadota bacterium]
MSADRRVLRAPPPPLIRWPGGARVAVSFVLNIEEGAELSVADGDERNELIYEAVDDVGSAPDPCLESHFGYGPRAGWPRIAALFARHGVPVTLSVCGRAAERTPWLIAEAAAAGHEIACHGWRWERHAGMDEATERTVIARTHAAVAKAAGRAPVGWHTRSAATPATRCLLVEHGGIAYDSDAYDDDMPRVETVDGHAHIVLPYAFDTNDMRFGPGGAFVQGADFAEYCLAAFDWLVREGADQPRMMSIGLHQRIIGRPGRIGGLAALLDGLAARGGAWITTRAEIAARWREGCGLPAWQPR